MLQRQDITKRGEAVESLLADFPEESAAARKLLKSVPDLERLLQRVHCNGYEICAYACVCMCVDTSPYYTTFPIAPLVTPCHLSSPHPRSSFTHSLKSKSGAGQPSHPDSRAVMYESPKYNVQKIKDFADTITGNHCSINSTFLLHYHR